MCNISGLIILFALLSTSPIVVGKIYQRCSLAKELHKLGVDKSDLSRWICIAKHESTFNSKAVGPVNSDGSRDYGIFQINDKYWCTPPAGAFSHNLCNVKCNAFLTDTIAADVKCARLILKEQGWRAWSTWRHCNGALPSVDDCF